MVEKGGMLRLAAEPGLSSDWETMLKEVNDFFKDVKIKTDPSTGAKSIESGVKSFVDIKKFLTDREKTWAKPMDGIILTGAEPNELLVNLRHNLDGGAKNMVRQAQGVAKKYSDYEALYSTPNGNCFFNAFSLLLYGNETLATRLRLAMCLGVMDGSLSGFNAISGGSMPTVDVNEINIKV